MKVIYPHENVEAFIKERKVASGFFSKIKLGGDLSHIKKIEMTFTKKFIRSLN